MRLQHPTHQADHRGSKMKRLLTLTLCLLTTGSAFNVLADPCDNLRNNQQAYRDCVNDWYGRSNRGSAPTPWWKNYDPNAGSDSGSAEQPQQYRPYVAPYVPPDPRERERRERGIAQSANLSEHGVALYKAGRFEEAVAFHRQALDLVRQYDSNGDNQAKGAYNLGLTLLEIKQYAEAETLFREALAIRERGVDLGKITNNHSSALEYLYLTIDNLATAIEGQSQYERAEPLRKRVYELRQKSQSVDHMDTWLAYRRLHANRESQTRQVIPNKSPEFNKQGTTHSAAGKYTEPAAASREAGAKHTETFKLLNAMNEALQREDYEKALKASENLLIWAKKENKDSLAAIAQRNKAKALIKLNRGGEAHDLLKALLATLDKTPPPLNRNEGFGDKQSALHGVLGDLAEENESSGGYGYAEPYRRRMLEIQEKTRGPEHLETLTALRDLANNLSRFGKYIAAVPVRQRAVAVAEKLPDAQSQLPELRKALLSDYRLAGGFDEQANALEAQIDWKAAWSRLAQEANKSLKARQYEEAIMQGQNVLDFAQKHSDTKDTHIAISQNNLGVYYRAAKEYEQAEVYYKKALESYATANGADSPSLITPLLELSSLYDLKKRYAEADVLYRRLLPLQEKKHGQEHLAVAKTLHKLAYFHVRNDRYSEAEPLYTRALAIIDKQPNNDDDVVLSILSGLADVYRYTQRDDEAKRLDERYQKWLARK